MNAKLQILKRIRPVVIFFAFSPAFACMAMGQLNSRNSISEELRFLDKIIQEIKWDNESNYLLYPGSGAVFTEKEEIQDIELWMVDVNCWNSESTDEMKELLCTHEAEYVYAVEEWMLKSYTNVIKKNILEPETENVYNVESWMYDLQEFRNLD
ncbi:MAG: hypothetical protein JXB00_18335 [Bacteroidales bacterium]|nr:hypothetical protein [Bacteroidales bacterium]